MSVDLDQVSRAAIGAICVVQARVRAQLRDRPFVATASYIPAGRFGHAKPASRCDLVAEDIGEEILRTYLARYHYDLSYAGEESPGATQAGANKHTLFALVDMIDGTDLLERGLGNWCSALAIYDQEKILSTYVGLSEGAIYYAQCDLPRPLKYVPPVELFDASTVDIPAIDLRQSIELRPGLVTVSLAEASVAFYGQRAGNFSAVASNKAFSRKMRSLARNRYSGFRLYNLGGNPMIVRMIDGIRRIDAVFDTVGHIAHDVVPAAFIALRAGAAFLDLKTGRSIDEKGLFRAVRGESMGSPEGKLTYVLASSDALAHEVRDSLCERRDRSEPASESLKSEA